ncbi:MAG: AraC family transcriptional regulator [Microthrixaceae bacterium]|nr:AraC family transcriptional regulator [Microthrixaceae bacterium]
MRLLTSTSLSIEQVARRLGYSDSSSFRRAFQGWTDLTKGLPGPAQRPRWLGGRAAWNQRPPGHGPHIRAHARPLIGGSPAAPALTFRAWRRSVTAWRGPFPHGWTPSSSRESRRRSSSIRI